MYLLNRAFAPAIQLALAVTLATRPTVAAEFIWTNPLGGDWNNASNWNLHQVPGAGDSASIPGGRINVIIQTSASISGLTLDGGSSLTVASNAVLNILDQVNLFGSLTNQGIVNWQGGQITVDYDEMYSSGEIWNEVGGLFDIQSDESLVSFFHTQPSFHNAGLVRKSAGAGTSYISIFFANNGEVQTQSGTIQFDSGSDLRGSFQADADTAIFFGGGYTLSSPPNNFHGPGLVRFSNSYVVLDEFTGVLDLFDTTVGGASALLGTLNLHQGRIGQDYPSSLTVRSNGVLNVLGHFNLYRELTNRGTVNWLGGEIRVFRSLAGGWTAKIHNEAGGLWDIQCDQPMKRGWDESAFNNVGGTARKSTGHGTSIIGIAFVNTGTVEARSGRIQFNGGGELNGSFTTEGSGTLSFGGDFTGIITNVLNCTVGNFGWGTSLTVATDGVLNILGEFTLLGGLTNAGTVNWLGGRITVCHDLLNGCYGGIRNQAGSLFDIQCDQRMDRVGNPIFENAGLVRKSASSGTSTISVFLANRGTVQAQSGTIQFGPASYSETVGANLAITIGGPASGANFGRVDFAGAPTFVGSFTATLRSGFRPQLGDSFSVLSYPSLAGDFVSMNGLDLGDGLRLEPYFAKTGLTLTAVSYPTNASGLPSLFVGPSGNGIRVAWPVAFTGWQLQSTTNLAAPAWMPVPVAGENNTALPVTGSAQYFRLSKP